MFNGVLSQLHYRSKQVPRKPGDDVRLPCSVDEIPVAFLHTGVYNGQYYHYKYNC